MLQYITSWYVPTAADIIPGVQTPPMMQQMGGDQPHLMGHVQPYQLGGASGRGSTPPYLQHPQYMPPPMQYPRPPGVVYPHQVPPVAMMPGMGPSPSQSSVNMGLMNPQSQLPSIFRPILGVSTPPYPVPSPYSHHQPIAPPSSLPATSAAHPMGQTPSATTSEFVSD